MLADAHLEEEDDGHHRVAVQGRRGRVKQHFLIAK
jgi:hypothetical protein